MVPPQNPSTSLAASPNFLYDGSCKESVLDDSATCNADVVKAVDNGRSTLESMSPLSLNLTAFDAMTAPEQIFVITDLERTDRGLAPVAGLTTQLDTVAQHRGGRQHRSDSVVLHSLRRRLGHVMGIDLGRGDGQSSRLRLLLHVRRRARLAQLRLHHPVLVRLLGPPRRDSRYLHQHRLQPAPSSTWGRGSPSSGSSYGPAFAGIVVGACGPTPTDVVFTWAQAEQELKGGSGASVPGPPQNVTAASSARGVVLTWQAPASDGGTPITGYTISRSRSAGAEKPYATVACTASSCSYTNRHAHAKRMFFYTVAATNAEGTGPTSSEVSAESR